MRCVSSASVITGSDKKAQLNIWNVTPAEAMLTPRSSRISPAARLAAIARKDSRRFAATFSKFILATKRLAHRAQLAWQGAENPGPNLAGDAIVDMGGGVL